MMRKYSACRLVLAPLTRKQKMRLCYLLQRSFLLPLHRPRLVAGIILGVIVFIHLVKEYSTNLTNYFKHQSDDARMILLQHTCTNIAAEENISSLRNRIDDIEPVPSEKIKYLTDYIIESVNITRNYTKEMLKGTLSCRTIDVDNLSMVLKEEDRLKDCINCRQRGNKLPLTALSLETGIQYSQHWKGLKLPIIGVKPRGRLGNVMGEYASIFALHKIYGVTTILTPDHELELAEFFPHLTLPVVDVDDWYGWIGLPVDERFRLKYEILELASLGLLGPHRFLAYDYSFETHLFNAFRPEIKREFRFSDDVLNRAQKYLSNVESSTGKMGSPTYIGVHGRFTDYPNHMNILYGIRYTNYDAFFHRAVKFCQDRFDNPVFIAASDDVDKMKATFARLGVEEVYYSEGSPAEDMALLSKCNHSIITFGTYGFWTAYLGSGITLYPDIQTPKPYRFSRPLYEYAQLNDFIPLPF